jgi:hypothetical protein
MKGKGNWNRVKILQKVAEQRTGTAGVKEVQKTAVRTAHTLREVLL